MIGVNCTWTKLWELNGFCSILYTYRIIDYRYIYIMEGNIQAGVIFISFISNKKESKQELLMVLSVHFSPKSHGHFTFINNMIGENRTWTKLWVINGFCSILYTSRYTFMYWKEGVIVISSISSQKNQNIKKWSSSSRRSFGTLYTLSFSIHHGMSSPLGIQDG